MTLKSVESDSLVRPLALTGRSNIYSKLLFSHLYNMYHLKLGHDNLDANKRKRDEGNLPKIVAIGLTLILDILVGKFFLTCRIFCN